MEAFYFDKQLSSQSRQNSSQRRQQPSLIASPNFCAASSTYRIDADVVPAFEHRQFEGNAEDYWFHSGTRILPVAGFRRFRFAATLSESRRGFVRRNTLSTANPRKITNAE
jgi:hypothetical protein